MPIHPQKDAVEATLDAAINGEPVDGNPEPVEAPAGEVVAQGATTQEEPVEGEEPKTDEQPVTSGGLELVQKIIDSKYKGDAEAFTKGLYEQWNSSAKLARKVEELEQRLAAGPTQAKPTPESDPNIQWLTNRTQAVDSQLNFNITRQNAIIPELDNLRVDHARLEGRIAATDDERIKDKLEVQQDRLTSRMENLRNEFFAIKGKNFDLEREQFSLSRLLSEQKEAYKEQPTRQTEPSTAVDTKWAANELTDFETSVFDVAVGAGLMPGSEDFDEFMETVKAKAIYEHQKHADEPVVETAKFAKELATKELKRFQKAAFQDFSAQKVQASGTKLTVPQSAKGVAPTQRQAARPAPTIPTGKLTAEQARAHTLRIMGG